MCNINLKGDINFARQQYLFGSKDFDKLLKTKFNYPKLSTSLAVFGLT